MIVEITRIRNKKCHKCLRLIINKTVEYEVHYIKYNNHWVVRGPLPGTLNIWYENSKEACDAIISHNKAIEDELQARQLIMEF